MSEVRVILIGIGGYGENYIKEMLNEDIPHAVLSAVIDPFIHKSPYYKEIVNRGIPVYKSPDSFYLNGGRAELAVISSPIHTHYDYILTCLKNGSNILTEKPVTVSIEKMNDLIEAERKSGLFVAVGYQLCFARDVLALKRDIIEGRFGKPIRMKALRLMKRGDAYYSRTGWAGKLKCHGEYVFDSPVSNACAHQIQVMLFFLGSEMRSTGTVERVDGVLWKGRPSIENFDAAALKIETAEGVPLNYYTAHSLDEKKVGPFIELEFDNGVIKSENDDFIAYMKDGTIVDYREVEKGKRLQKLYDAIEAARGGEIPYVTLATSLAHIKCVLECEKLPVYFRYDAEYKDDEGDGYYAIPNLAKSYLESYDSWSLPETWK